MTITRNKILRYTLTPQIVPRIKNLFGHGFACVAWYIALVFWGARLLPENSPCLQNKNFGQFGVFEVVSQAARHIKFKWRNIDQIIIFICVLAGIAALLAQFLILIFSIFLSNPAIAQVSTEFANWFTVADPSQHIDRVILDRVFGVSGIFDSCISTGAQCLDVHGQPIVGTNGVFPSPMSRALQDLFAFYNWIFAAVAAIVVLYFVVVITVETATTGTPFGKRFSKAWVPLRLAMFVGLMIPTASGFNLGQIGVLHIAKYGGALATNAWIKFNADLTGTYLGDHASMIAMANAPEVTNLAQFMFTVKACQIAEGALHKGAGRGEIKPYIVRGVLDELLGGGGSNSIDMQGTPYKTAYEFSRHSKIIIRFGEKDKDKYPTEIGFVYPTCGEISVEPQSMSELAAQGIYEEYYNMILEMWNDAIMQEVAICLAKHVLPHSPNLNCPTPPSADFAFALIEKYQNELEGSLSQLQAAHIAKLKAEGTVIPAPLLAKGWGGAAIWFNRIAQMNGAITSALLHIPVPSKMPALMEEVREIRQATLKTTSNGVSGNLYNPSLSGTATVKLEKYPFSDGVEIASFLNTAYTIMDRSGVPHSTVSEGSDNMFINMVNLIMGTDGIFDIRKNASANPLAQITALGRGVVERSMQSLILAAGSFVGEKVAGMIFPSVGALTGTMTTFFFTFGMIGIIIGFILAYVTPFMPMLYFVFALSGWIKSVFEAIVAIPLWGVAHLRIDGGGEGGAGSGLPGRDASAGYFLLLEILLRPILIIVGLLASVIIFSSTILVFHDIYDLVLTNMSGHEPIIGVPTPMQIEFYRDAVDEFFFTVLYTIIVYMIGSSSFKMIDEVPNQVMRWIGFQVSTFQEGIQDPAGQIQQRIYSGSLLMSNQMNQGTSRLAVLSNFAGKS